MVCLAARMGWLGGEHVSTTRRLMRAWTAACVLAIAPMLYSVVAHPPKVGAGGGISDASVEGYWGPRTASTNWCEADYVVTKYIAEFGNTLSSLALVSHGLYGFAMHLYAEGKFYVAFAVMTVVGIGSMLFHATLLRSMQLADELPMVWANGVLFYLLATTERPKSKAMWWIGAIGITLYIAAQTAAIVVFDDDDQSVFLVCYATGVVYTTTKAMMFDTKFKVQSSLLDASSVAYLTSLVVWLIDRLYCPSVQHLHLHSWWHLGASTGTFCFILHILYVRQVYLQRRPQTKGFYPVPYVAIQSQV